jgi:hypothetical protein
MSKDKIKESVKKSPSSANRFRWGILFSVTILFSVILFPNLIVTNHRYSLGDVAERDIKAPRDFFIEDESATEANRRQAVAAVLTVYDYDAGLAVKLAGKVSTAFAEMRSTTALPEETRRRPPDSDQAAAPAAAAGEPAVFGALDPRRYFEQKLGIRVSKGAYAALETAGFSPEIAARINRILIKVLDNGVVTNKEILLKESEKGIVLLDVGTKEEKELYQLKKFYGLDQAKTMVRIVGQPLLNDLDYGMLNLVVDFVQRLIQPNVTLNRSETEKRKDQAAVDIKPVLHKIKAGEMLLREG